MKSSSPTGLHICDHAERTPKFLSEFLLLYYLQILLNYLKLYIYSHH